MTTSLAEIEPTTNIGIAWRNFNAALRNANEKNAAFDTARDQALEANIMDPRRAIAEVAAEYGVEPARLAIIRANAVLTTARANVIAAYREEFGEPGVQRLEVFLSALQQYGDVHPMVKVGSHIKHQLTGPAAISAANDALGQLWL